MKIRGITEAKLREAVETASGELYEHNLTFNREPEQLGSWLHFTLRVHKCGDPGTHIGMYRRTFHACWHAHRDVMRAIFRLAPDALLITALARYEGSAGFEHEFPATGNVNCGSMMQPRTRQEACEC